MIDEQELERLRAVEEGWDQQSCAEYEEFLEDVYWESREPEEPPCECWQVDVDLFDNRACPAHNLRLKEF